MSAIELDIRDDLLHFHFSLNRRINFIRGKSATGKTSFYELLSHKILDNDENVVLDCNIDVDLLDYRTVKNFSQTDVLYIVDDLSLINDHNFIKQYNSMLDRNLWFLIMDRTELVDDLKTALTFSSNCLFRLDNIDSDYFLRPLYDIKGTITDSKYDCVIVEDSKAGFQFFSRLFNVCKVISSEGKDNIVRRTKEAINMGYSNILVLYDSASFGSCYEEFYKTFKFSSVNVNIISSYECFEELLVNTSLLRNLDAVKYSLDNIGVEANKFSSWERFYEHLVMIATKDKPYKCSHKSDLGRCYSEPCISCNSHIKEKCDYCRKDEDKFIGLLSGSKYGFLLNNTTQIDL